MTLLSRRKIEALHATLAAVRDVPGDFAELGVYRGGSARILATAAPARTVHLFDTFGGMPPAATDGDAYKAGDFSDCTLADVKTYLADCPNVVYHPGIFPKTAIDGQFACVHIDADLYASTLAGLEWFWPRLSPGGAIVLDDYDWHLCRGVERAASEFFNGRSGGTAFLSSEHQLTIFKLGASMSEENQNVEPEVATVLPPVAAVVQSTEKETDLRRLSELEGEYLKLKAASESNTKYGEPNARTLAMKGDAVREINAIKRKHGIK